MASKRDSERRRLIRETTHCRRSCRSKWLWVGGRALCRRVGLASCGSNAVAAAACLRRRQSMQLSHKSSARSSRCPAPTQLLRSPLSTFRRFRPPAQTIEYRRFNSVIQFARLSVSALTYNDRSSGLDVTVQTEWTREELTSDLCGHSVTHCTPRAPPSSVRALQHPACIKLKVRNSPCFVGYFCIFL